jgi:hypothetical protein
VFPGNSSDPNGYADPDLGAGIAGVFRIRIGLGGPGSVPDPSFGIKTPVPGSCSVRYYYYLLLLAWIEYRYRIRDAKYWTRFFGD